MITKYSSFEAFTQDEFPFDELHTIVGGIDNDFYIEIGEDKQDLLQQVVQIHFSQHDSNEK